MPKYLSTFNEVGGGLSTVSHLARVAKSSNSLRALSSCSIFTTTMSNLKLLQPAASFLSKICSAASSAFLGVNSSKAAIHTLSKVPGEAVNFREKELYDF